MIRRRTFITLVSPCAAESLIAGAQPRAKTPRVALVNQSTSLAEMLGDEPGDVFTQRFVRRLRELGYVEGQNILIERRSAESRTELLPQIMQRLVDERVDVIVTLGEGATEARRATNTIPILAYVDDPIRAGLTASLGRPTQNVTGVTVATPGSAITAKQLQLLKQAVPTCRRVAAIDYKHVDAHTTPGTHSRRVALEAPARELRLTLIFAGANSADDFDEAFALIERERADALLDIGTPVTWANRRRLIDFAARRRLPAIYGYRRQVEEGGLMSYGPSDVAAARLAELVDKILKGARPADLPFEQPREYELAINLSTASLLGLTIPRSLLLTAELVK